MTGKWALTSTVALLLVACGGSQPASTKAPSADDGAPRTVEEAQDQIDTARAAIDQGFASASIADGGTETSAPSMGGAEATGGGAAAPSADVCASQCRALDSMKRAVEALCRMTGENEGRCVSAKRTFDASATRVAACKCPNASSNGG